MHMRNAYSNLIGGQLPFEPSPTYFSAKQSHDSCARFPRLSLYYTAMASLFNFASLFLVCLAFSVPLSRADSSTTTDLLWPLPRKATFGSSIYSLQASSFQFLSSGAGGASDILKGAFERYISLIFETPVPFYPSGNGGSSAGALQNVTVAVKSSNETLGPDTDESCKLLS